MTPLSTAFARPWPTTRRGLKLWLFAIIIALKGMGYVTGSTSASTDSALRLISSPDGLGLPLQVCGVVILVLCGFAVLTSYCHHGSDRFGYMALVGFCFAWSACFAVSPLLLDGPSYAYQGALSYALIALFLLFSAADPEPQPGTMETRR